MPDLPYVGLEHLGVGTLHLVGTGICRDVASSSLLVEPGEVLFGKLRPYFRKVVRAPMRLVCTGEAWVLTARTGVDQRFLFYLAANPLFVDACSAASTGTRMPRADWAFAAAQPVALPSLCEQRRIAAVLGALDDKIELNRKMNRTLEEMAQAIFKSWFIDFDGYDDLVDSEIGPVPRGWEVGGIDAVAENVRDTVDPNGLPGDTPYVGLEHVPRRCVSLDTWGRAADAGSTKTRFQRGDVLFGKLRPYFHKVVPAPVDGVSSTDILVIRPNQEDWRWFAFGHLYSDAMVAHTTAAADGTKMPRTNWKDLCHFPVAIPPRERAAEYGSMVMPMFERIAANVQESRTLATLRDTLLPKLISGELRVPEAEALVGAAS
jgi:type I restriction enzyme S subunit